MYKLYATISETNLLQVTVSKAIKEVVFNCCDWIVVKIYFSDARQDRRLVIVILIHTCDIYVDFNTDDNINSLERF